MNLLSEIEYIIKSHPFRDKSIEFKFEYMMAISLFFDIDEYISPIEKKNYKFLIYLLNMAIYEENLLNFLKNPKVDDFEKIFNLLDTEKALIKYFIEVFYLKDKNDFLNKKEKRFINLITKKWKLEQNSILDLFEFLYKVKNDKLDNLPILNIDMQEELNTFNNCYGIGYTKIEILAAIRNGENQLGFLKDKWKDDEDIVLEEIKIDGMQLKYASERIKDDEDIVFQAIKNNPDALKYATSRLQNKFKDKKY